MADKDIDARARMEAKRRTLLRDVERALLDALAESPQALRALSRLQRQGWTLEISLDCRRSEEAEPTTNEPARRPARQRQPVFRIDVEDLRFLRSIGIDPTRRRLPKSVR